MLYKIYNKVIKIIYNTHKISDGRFERFSPIHLQNNPNANSRFLSLIQIPDLDKILNLRIIPPDPRKNISEISQKIISLNFSAPYEKFPELVIPLIRVWVQITDTPLSRIFNLKTLPGQENLRNAPMVAFIHA